MIRAFLFAALLALGACQSLTPSQVSAVNYQGIAVLQDAVIAKHSVCVSQGKLNCSERALDELLKVDEVLIAANQYDDFRLSGLLDAAELSLGTARTKAQELQAILEIFVPPEQRPLLEWSDE